MNPQFELDPEELAKMVDVRCGIHTARLPLDGVTLGEVLPQLVNFLNIGPDAVPFLDGEPVGEETVLSAGQSLIFMRQSAAMG